MPACHNCGNTESFVLLVVCSAAVDVAGEFHDPSWSLSVQCHDCASTDVAGDAASLLARYASS